MESLHDWQNFYVMTGGAVAALVGLMFIGVSLGSHLVNDEHTENIRTYVNPTLFHFVSVFVISCIVLVPTHTTTSFAILIGLVSLVGLRQVTIVVKRMRKETGNEADEANHWIWHGWLPYLSYGMGCAVTVGLISTGSSGWLNGLAVMVVTLVVCAIRNMWILILWIASQH